MVLAALPYAFGGMAGLGFDPAAPPSVRWPRAYENLLCTGLCVGLLILFREHAIGGHVLLRSLAASSYAVYIVHVPIVVALQFSVAPAGPSPLAAFVAVSVLSELASFGCAEVLRRLPGFRSVL